MGQVNMGVGWALLLATLCLLLSLGLGLAHAHGTEGAPQEGFLCGSHRRLAAVHGIEPEKVSQTYDTWEHPAARALQEGNNADVFWSDADSEEEEEDESDFSRFLASQAYWVQNNTGDFLPLSQADEAGLTRNLRIHLIFHTVEDGESRQCTAVGNVITVDCDLSGTTQCSHTCTSSDVIGGTSSLGLSRLAILKQRLEWAAEYWGKTLLVKPVRDAITIPPNLQSVAAIRVTSVQNADMVVIVTSRPVPRASVNAYAWCGQYDQYSRCTVGFINWLPNVIGINTASEASTVRADYHTATHELMHLLGGMQPSDLFIDDEGNSRLSEVYTVQPSSSDYPKRTTYITTERVVQIVRRHFECNDLPGAPLEDQRLGRLSHWEARVFGAEFMSYGSMVGEVFVSDLTLAFLEDTNQYIADYSKAGPLVPESGSEPPTVAVETFYTSALVEETPPEPTLTPGALRWGREQGCDFVLKSARHWTERFRCSSDGEYSCSADNRVSSLCVIDGDIKLKDFDGYTCGDFDDQRCTSITGDDWTCYIDHCELPPMYQYFTDSEAARAAGLSSATAGSTGGVSSAMDYAPIRFGYWDCQNVELSPLFNANVTRNNDGQGGGSSLTQRIQEATGFMSMFGGQSHCKNCRCFQSSLVELTRAKVDPKFPRFGLCYRSNCYTANHLQFGLPSQFDRSFVYWYACPEEGGKLYIPGYTGAFHCPPAAEFCAYETITGIRYPETNLLLEWIVLGVALGVPFLLASCCICVPCFRRRTLRFLKRCMGVGHFVLLVPRDPRRQLIAIENALDLAGVKVNIRRGSVTSASNPNTPATAVQGKDAAAMMKARRRASWAGAHGVNMGQVQEAAKAFETLGVRRALRASGSWAVQDGVQAKGVAKAKKQLRKSRVSAEEQEKQGSIHAWNNDSKAAAPRHIHSGTTSDSNSDDDSADDLVTMEAMIPVHADAQRQTVAKNDSFREDELAAQKVRVAAGGGGVKIRRQSLSMPQNVDLAMASMKDVSIAVNPEESPPGGTKKPIKSRRASLQGNSINTFAAAMNAAQVAKRRSSAAQAAVAAATAARQGKRRQSAVVRSALGQVSDNMYLTALHKSVRSALPKRASAILFIVSLLGTLCGIGLGVLAVISFTKNSATAIGLLGFVLFALALAALGLAGSRRRAEVASCALIAYFYVLFFTCVAVALTVTWVLLFSDSTYNWLLRNWSIFESVVPFLINLGAATREAAVDEFLTNLSDNLAIVIVVVVVVVLAIILGLGSSAYIMSIPIINGTLFTVGNHCYIIGGAVLIIVSLFYLIDYAVLSHLFWLELQAIGLGVGLITLGIIGVVGAFRKARRVLIFYFIANILLMGAVGIIGYQAFSAAFTVSEDLAQYSDASMLELAEKSGGKGATRGLLEEALRNTLRWLALFICAIGLTAFILALNVLFFLRAMKRVRYLLSYEGIKQLRSKIANAEELGLKAGIDLNDGNGMVKVKKGGAKGNRRQSIQPLVVQDDVSGLADSPVRPQGAERGQRFVAGQHALPAFRVDISQLPAGGRVGDRYGNLTSARVRAAAAAEAGGAPQQAGIHSVRSPEPPSAADKRKPGDTKTKKKKKKGHSKQPKAREANDLEVQDFHSGSDDEYGNWAPAKRKNQHFQMDPVTNRPTDFTSSSDDDHKPKGRATLSKSKGLGSRYGNMFKDGKKKKKGKTKKPPTTVPKPAPQHPSKKGKTKGRRDWGRGGNPVNI